MQKVTININVAIEGTDDVDAREKLFSALHSLGIDYTIEDLWIEEDED